jgi:tetratricopeptide (TPR) repeat protein
MRAREAGKLDDAVALMRQAIAETPERKNWRLELGAILRILNRPGEAEPILRALLEEDPLFWSAALELGLCRRLQGDLTDAERLLAKAFLLAPSERFVRLEYATTLRLRGRLAEAQTLFEALLADIPDFWQARAQLAKCRLRQGDRAGALECLAAALALAPQDRGMRLDYATLLRETGRIEEAQPLYRGLLDAPDPPVQALTGLGICRRLQRDLAESETLLAAAAAAAPRDPAVLLEYATTLREAHRLEAAEAVYRRMLEIEPRGWTAELGLGLCARSRKDYEATVLHLMRAIHNAPGVGVVWFELATEYREAGRWAEARALLGALLASPEPIPEAVPAALLNLGYVARSAGDRAEAARIFRAGAARFPDSSLFVLEIALEAQVAGDLEETETWLRRATEIPALAGRAWRRLGEIAAIAMQLEDALVMFRRAATQADASAELFALIAQTLADLGRPGEAFAELDAAGERFGPHPDLARKRISLLRQAGSFEEALQAARQAVAAAPAHFPLWCEWFETEFRAGDAASLAHCLEAAPASTHIEHAQVQNARGQAAERRWDLEAAAAAYRESVRLSPLLDGVHFSLARVSLLGCDTAATFEHLKQATDLQMSWRRLQGMVSRPSQTHLGQLANEFALDRDLLARLAALQPLPPGERIAPLCELVRAAPDHTPTAMMLMLALRRDGRLDGPGEEGGESLIPRRIMQFWTDPEPPPDVAALMQSWQRQNPGHAYRLFNTVSAAAFLEEHHPAAVRAAFRAAREPALKADLFRLAWLSTEGGLYADADDRCLRPLDPLLSPPARFVSFMEEFATLGNNFLAAVPHHPIIEDALARAVEAIGRGDHDIIWLATGPGLLTRAAACHLATRMDDLGEMRILDRAVFDHVVAAHCAALYKRTGRHWLRARFAASTSRTRRLVAHAREIGEAARSEAEGEPVLSNPGAIG